MAINNIILDFTGIDTADDHGKITIQQRKRFFMLLNQTYGKPINGNYGDHLPFLNGITGGRCITSIYDLSYAEMKQVITYLDETLDKNNKIRQNCKKNVISIKEPIEYKETQTKLFIQDNEIPSNKEEKQLSIAINENTITGIVTGIRFKSNDNFNIFAIETNNGESVNVTGYASDLEVDQEVMIVGEWIKHPKYGRQYKANSIQKKEPETEEGITKYIQTFPGIGEKIAKEIVNQYGLDTLKIIANHPERLLEIKGITEEKLNNIIKSYQKVKESEKTMIYLLGLGLTLKQANKIYDKYQNESIAKIQLDPYLLIKDIEGIGFSRADTIALAAGYPREGEKRIIAGLNYIIDQAADFGSTGIYRNVLSERTKDLLMLQDINLVENTINNQIEKENFIYHLSGIIQTRYMCNLEQYIANTLIKIRNNSYKLKYDKNPVVYVESLLNIQLSNSQKQALETCLNNNISIITGNPGTGKTMVTKSIIECLEEISKDYLLVAPTGKAAKRLSESTDRSARTIHRALADNAFSNIDVVIIDESSMINIFLIHELLHKLEETTKIIFVGDVDQLPCIGAGNLLGDLIESNEFAIARLTEIQRQAKDSLIVNAAHNIRNGLFPSINNSLDFRFEEHDTPEEIISCINAIFRVCLDGHDLIKDVTVLTPMKKGPLGVNALNTHLQHLLNYHPDLPCLDLGKSKFYLNDKVMQIKNNYNLEVFNGESGIITEINKENKKLTVDYYDKQITYDETNFSELTLAYATTIHKSQGSEYPVTIVVCHKSHFIMLTRKLIYTAITRGKKLVYVIGQRQALGISINTNKTDERISLLQNKIQKAIQIYNNNNIKNNTNAKSFIEELIDEDEIPF